jgi:hypothetical protein
MNSWCGLAALRYHLTFGATMFTAIGLLPKQKFMLYGECYEFVLRQRNMFVAENLTTGEYERFSCDVRVTLLTIR